MLPEQNFTVNRINCINPLDSRYSNETRNVNWLFSDFNLTGTKVSIELKYFAFLVDNADHFGIDLLKDVNKDYKHKLTHLINSSFTDEDYELVKEEEKRTKHDIKAIEYFVKNLLFRKFTEVFRMQQIEFVHFGLTSQDIVSLSYAIHFKKYYETIFTLEMASFIYDLDELIKLTKNHIIIARTHGQLAVPTTMANQLTVYKERIKNITSNYKINISAKFGGAIGDLSAHRILYPNVNWDAEMDHFVALNFDGMHRSKNTTQIDNYDSFGSFLDLQSQISNILIDFCRDIWSYISMGYFGLKTDTASVGSSTMAQKINPIDFENAEGNLEIVVMWLNFLNDKLRKSRLQRDLTDSTIMRNIGVPFGHFSVAMHGLVKGMAKLTPNSDVSNRELISNYQILAEIVQLILKKHGRINAYELVKSHFVGKNSMTKDEYIQIVGNMGLSKQIVDELVKLSPETYNVPQL